MEGVGVRRARPLRGARRALRARRPRRARARRRAARARPADRRGAARPARRGGARRPPASRRAASATCCSGARAWRCSRRASCRRRRRPCGASAEVLARELGWSEERLELELARFAAEAAAEGSRRLDACVARPGWLTPPCSPSGPRRAARARCRRERAVAGAARPRADARARAAPAVADGDRQRLARLLQRRRAATRASTRRRELAAELLAAGADILDVGGESASTGRPPLASQAEIERVVPLVRAARRASSARSSRSTPTSPRSRARRSRRARGSSTTSAACATPRSRTCARDRARRWCSCTRVRRPASACRTPISTRTSPPRCSRSCASASRLAVSRGVAREQLILDPGPDFAKTPAQTIELLSEVERLHELGRPLLMAISRKDFIGALTAAPAARAPARERSRRSPTAWSTARTSSACTTSPPPPTSSPCAPRSPRESEPSRDLGAVR